MRNISLLIPATIGMLAAGVALAGEYTPKVKVDSAGVMRNTCDNTESAYYGTNYTLPFAHAYRAVKALGNDMHEVIDRDVYHFKRLGFNAFRVHLWDAELADSAGNIKDNEHLELLDYLFDALEREGIDIIITAQTNFGNGYPERNIDTGAFTYDFEKCKIHEDPVARKIQANYLDQLLKHTNRYSGRQYGMDPDIIGIEINNEPCHSGSPDEVTRYIDDMSQVIRDAGFRGLILYNVSHNPGVTSAYYQARDVQGTTYQWYPNGLVAGYTRKGNLLPYVDEYVIPWRDTIAGYDEKARLVYEFDPADVMAAYLYPAAARTFRKNGFQWATQFSYDPTPIAPYNTEYQTHYLNLLYTPSKALSMAVAAEVMRYVPRNASTGGFPNDSVFYDFRLSPSLNLSEYVTPQTYLHSNSTATPPPAADSLVRIAGVGSSPVVEYSGSGAYFLDRIGRNIWRLEVMPDIIVTEDPFAKPSLTHPVGWLDYKENEIRINLPGLGDKFCYSGLNEGNTRKGKGKNKIIDVYPGVYILYPQSAEKEVDKLIASADDTLYRFAAPAKENIPESAPEIALNFEVPKFVKRATPLKLELKAFPIAATAIDSIVVFPSDISFWRTDNPSFRMKKGKGDNYSVVIPAQFTDRDRLEFQLTIFTPEAKITYPPMVKGEPLDWDFRDYTYYTVETFGEKTPLRLYSPGDRLSNIDITAIPSDYSFSYRILEAGPESRSSLIVSDNPNNEGTLLLSRYVGDITSGSDPAQSDRIVLLFEGDIPQGLSFLAVDRAGITRQLPLDRGVKTRSGSLVKIEVPLKDMTPRSTLVPPTPFPDFLGREITPSGIENLPAGVVLPDIEFIQLAMPREVAKEKSFNLCGIWAPMSSEKN